MQHTVLAVATGIVLSAFVASLPPHPIDDAPQLRLSDAWARATPPDSASGEAFLTVVNSGRAPDRLTQARTPVASAVLFLSPPAGDGDAAPVMSEIPVPAYGRTVLRPGDMHLSLGGLTGPLIAGASFPMTLQFEQTGEMVVDVTVVRPGTAVQPR